MDPLSGLRVRRAHWEKMAAEAARHAPEEACGLVAGQAGSSVEVFPVENHLHSPVRFRMHPQQQVHSYFAILRNGWELAAIYHSHPQGQARPSATDIAEAAYPEAIYLIWYPHQGSWDCRGYRIWEGQVFAVPVRIQDE